MHGLKRADLVLGVGFISVEDLKTVVEEFAEHDDCELVSLLYLSSWIG